MKPALKYYGLVLGIVIIDQIIKLWAHFALAQGFGAGEYKVIADWFKLHYTLNEGMAFGMKLGIANGKLWLSLLRLLFVVFLGGYLTFLLKNKHYRYTILSIILVMGGAIGNLCDSIFYGYCLDNAPTITPEPLFYPWFHGQVIDMFYFDVWEGLLPMWMPFLGGSYIALLPVFNFADLMIFIGISMYLWSYRK